jgi:hypothetical protein
LSDHGRRQKLQDFAKAEAGHVAKAKRALAAAQEAQAQQRNALLPTVKDKANVASAMLRQEARALLRGKSQAEAAALLFDPNADSILIEAVIEAPLALSGISADMKDKLQRTAGPMLIALAEQDEALSLLNAALRMSSETLREAVDIHPTAYDEWLAKAAPVDPKETAAELAKVTRDTIAASANALPLAERTSLIDQLLATNVASIRAA